MLQRQAAHTGTGCLAGHSLALSWTCGGVQMDDVKWLCRTCRFVGSGQRRIHVHGKVRPPSAHPSPGFLWTAVVCLTLAALQGKQRLWLARRSEAAVGKLL